MNVVDPGGGTPHDKETFVPSFVHVAMGRMRRKVGAATGTFKAETWEGSAVRRRATPTALRRAADIMGLWYWSGNEQTSALSWKLSGLHETKPILCFPLPESQKEEGARKQEMCYNYTMSENPDRPHKPESVKPELSRRDFLAGAAAFLGTRHLLAQFGKEIDPAGPQPVEIVREGKDGHIDATVRIQDAAGKILDPAKPLLPGAYKLYTGSKPGTLVEARYEVLDAAGKIVESFPKTHVPVQNVLIEKGQRLRVVQLPGINVAEKSYQSARRFSGLGAEDLGRPVVYERLRETQGHHFGVTLEVQNLETGKKTELSDEGAGAAIPLPPGTYQVLGHHSRYGFPQFFTFVVTDAANKNTLEQTHSTRLPARLVLEKGEQLHARIPPAVRPYNSSFFTIGRENPSEAAVIFARPYPSMNGEAGTFHGLEQFNSVQLSIAFWGMKLSKEQPDIARKIREEGVETLRPGTPCRDPELVLGAREVARDLARTFIAQRAEQKEDYRGAHHATFLQHRRPDGTLHPDLLTMKEEELTSLLEKHLLRMMEHNVHRVTEGGGYADTAFIDVFNREAKAKVRTWPETSVRATEMYREYYQKAKGATDGKVEVLAEGKPNDREQIPAEIAKTRLLAAIVREKMNYERYPADWLKDAERALGKTVAQRLEELAALEKELRA